MRKHCPRTFSRLLLLRRCLVRPLSPFLPRRRRRIHSPPRFCPCVQKHFAVIQLLPRLTSMITARPVPSLPETRRSSSSWEYRVEGGFLESFQQSVSRSVGNIKDDRSLTDSPFPTVASHSYSTTSIFNPIFCTGLVPEPASQVPETGEAAAKGFGAIRDSVVQRDDAQHPELQCVAWVSALPASQLNKSISPGEFNAK